MSSKLSQLPELGELSEESLFYVVSQSGSGYTQNKVKLSTLVQKISSIINSEDAPADPDIVTITINYSLNGGMMNGSSIVSSQTISGVVGSTKSITLPDGVFVKSGYTFSKWKSSDTNISHDRGSSVAFIFESNKTITFTAQWIADSSSSTSKITLRYYDNSTNKNLIKIENSSVINNGTNTATFTLVNPSSITHSGFPPEGRTFRYWAVKYYRDDDHYINDNMDPGEQVTTISDVEAVALWD